MSPPVRTPSLQGLLKQEKGHPGLTWGSNVCTAQMPAPSPKDTGITQACTTMRSLVLLASFLIYKMEIEMPASLGAML